MALFNSFKFGDVDSKDYGVYISGDSVYDSPARSVDLVQVPGRNGALALDNGYYENIEVTYPAGSFGTSQEEWREKMLGIRNALAAQRGYQKLIDTYHPEHYRLGMFFAGISASPVQYNRAGQFPIRFNCKPQRFLISGDTPVEFTEAGQEEGYGPSNIVSFEAEEGAEIRELKVNLEPVQDLNGYDNPWPAGGGKNMLDLEYMMPNGTTSSDGKTFTTSTIGSRRTLVFSDTNIDVILSCKSMSFGGTSFRIGFYDTSGTLINNIYFNTTEFSNTIRGVAKCKVDYGNNGVLTLNECMLRLATETDATFAPYSNICPISGHTEVNVSMAQKNVISLDELIIAPSGQIKNYTFKHVLTMHLRPLTKYTMSTSYNGTTNVLYLNGSTTANVVKAGTPRTAQTDEEGTLVVALYDRAGIEEFEGKTVTVQLELGSTATTYEPYAGQTYPISLGRTVYGGTLNVTTGVLTVDRTMVDLGTLGWNGIDGLFNVTISNALTPSNNIYCSQYKTVAATTPSGSMPDYSVKSYGNASSKLFYIRDSRYSTAAAFKTAMNGVQLVYELATPTTAQLSPTQVSTLLGANNVWADGGEVEVTVAEPTQFENPTNFASKPLVRVYGNGTVRVGDTIATVQNNTNYIDIDCEAMNCTDGSTNRNSDVSFSGNDFPVLEAGANSILLNGPSKVEITPRWWEL